MLPSAKSQKGPPAPLTILNQKGGAVGWGAGRKRTQERRASTTQAKKCAPPPPILIALSCCVVSN